MNRPEQQIQQAIVRHLRSRGVPGLVFFHVPNGGKRTLREGWIFKSLGVRAGVSDIIAVHDGKIFALELKSEDGRLKESQIEFLQDMEKTGAYTAVATGLDQAIATLEAWQLLKGRAT